ncbi:MAG: hypothetical protein ACLP50_08280 [Solirubrobacteraceae bacterium]
MRAGEIEQRQRLGGAGDPPLQQGEDLEGAAQRRRTTCRVRSSAETAVSALLSSR